MPDPQPSRLALSDIVAAVANAPDIEAAFDVLAGAVSRELRARVSLVRREERGWRLLAQARGGLHVAAASLALAMDVVPSGDRAAVLDLRAFDEGAWTSVPLGGPNDRPLVLLISGDWTTSDVAESLRLLLRMAINSVAAGLLERMTRRVCVDAHAMARRLSRLTSVDKVCRQIVEQVRRSLDVDRVTLALYRPAENRLAIAAGSGELPLVREDVRIEPGSWVMGHVYSTGRSVVVSDIRDVGGSALDRPHYRTSSFAAVPILAGVKRVGVLCATDKRDGSSFGDHDEFVLRIFAASAALALAAANSDTEVHRLVHASTVDALTGLFNRPYLDVRLSEEIERAKRGANSLTVLMADVDNFKSVNDTYGHQEGDDVLRRVAGTFRAAVRVFDVCARYGGDEFAILMPSSSQTSAVTCAERIRQCVEGDDVTISIGVAVFEPGDDPAALIRRADRSLYQAKADGKNCVRTNADRQNVLHMAPPATFRGEQG